MPATRPSTGEATESGAPVRRIGPYEVIRPLGRGGMGEVYLARDLRLGRLVAVKLLTNQSPDLDERLLAEARATARCRHDNIVVIYEVGAHAGRPYMVLEYLEGQTMREWLTGRVPAARAIELMLPVVRALAYAHEQHIVHRDLKPENVMLTRTGGIKVLDFGVAQIGGEAESLRGGTRAYMAPEQLGHGAVDHRSDVWAAGIMLHELVAGVRPADGSAELGSLGAVIERCLIADPAHRTPSARALLAELEVLGAAGGVARTAETNPFAGLAAFQEVDADRFFGRDRDIAQVIAELRTKPLVAVVGASGAGKSSLVRAGVVPALKRSGEGWDAYVVRPGREPLAALAQLDDADPATLREEPGGLGARLRARALAKRRRIVVFVDQLEELYTQGVPVADRLAFLACLAAIADDAASPLRVVVAMRADFLDRLAEDRRFGGELARGLVLLSPMDREGMRDALVRPVEASDHRFEGALVDRMIDELAATRGALPLLQFTAARLWERRDPARRLLTEASYDELDGVAGALATHADAVVAAMSAAQQALASAVMIRLVTPERTRAIASTSELHAMRSDPALVDEIINHLTEMRLVVVERGVDDATVELVHESLVDRWPTLVRWLDENQDDAAMLVRLRAVAKAWERASGAAGLLWTGEVAHEARTWHGRYRGELTALEQRYLAAVDAMADRARRRRRRLFGGILASAIVIAIVTTWLAWKQSEARPGRRGGEARPGCRADRRDAYAAPRSDDPARAAPRDRGSARGTGERGRRGEARPPCRHLERGARGHHRRRRGVQPGRQAHRVGIAGRDDPDLERRRHRRAGDPARSSRHGVVRRVQPRWAVDRLDRHGPHAPRVGGRWPPRTDDLRGHTGEVRSAAFTPDGLRIVSASFDSTLRIWNADGRGEPVILRGHEDGVQAVEVSADGRSIVSASFDHTIRVWNADGRGEPRVLRGHDSGVMWAAFSPDGRSIVSSSVDRTIRIWRADGSGEPVTLLGHDLPVEQVHFSPDGRSVLSASRDGTLRVWRDLAAVALDDPRLWTATNYCMSVDRRVVLLTLSEAAARREQARCLERVSH